MSLIAVGSNRLSELIEAGSDTELFGEGVDAEFVVAASNVLDERWGQTGRFRLAPRASGIGPEAARAARQEAGRFACGSCGQLWLTMDTAIRLDALFDRLLASGAELAQAHWEEPVAA